MFSDYNIIYIITELVNNLNSQLNKLVIQATSAKKLKELLQYIPNNLENEKIIFRRLLEFKRFTFENKKDFFEALENVQNYVLKNSIFDLTEHKFDFKNIDKEFTRESKKRKSNAIDIKQNKKHTFKNTNYVNYSTHEDNLKNNNNENVTNFYFTPLVNNETCLKSNNTETLEQTTQKTYNYFNENYLKVIESVEIQTLSNKINNLNEQITEQKNTINMFYKIIFEKTIENKNLTDNLQHSEEVINDLQNEITKNKNLLSMKNLIIEKIKNKQN